jgi:hypothetical protein
MKSEQEIYDEQLKEIKKIASEKSKDEVLDFLIFYESQIKTFGIIYLISSLEESDNHCDQCRNEVLSFGLINWAEPSNKVLPKYCVAIVGETKFNKIKTKDFNFYGFSSDEIKIID